MALNRIKHTRMELGDELLGVPLTYSEMAKLVGVESEREIREMEAGCEKIPPYVRFQIELIDRLPAQQRNLYMRERLGI